MQKELEELQPQLVTAQEENAKMMVVIERESAEVEARSKVVRKDEELANEKAAEAQALKDEVRSASKTKYDLTAFLLPGYAKVVQSLV